MKFLQLATIVLVGVASALPRIVKRDSTVFNLELPSNASVIVGNINPGFDCQGRKYGYYADPANNCQIFHICYPYTDPLGVVTTRFFSFLCGQGTIFDQATLTCNFPQFSHPCESATNLYNINDYFNREDRQFRDGLNDIF
ncbi:U-scoloptoxin(01)-Cw1a-like [Macrobrachium nipponense]|uniref:U-scoloptoxin(01)-Cw1a-like n=1 Tax=Macrobrachium nipponense TaxID=159736 RepID=UPI0030C8829F